MEGPAGFRRRSQQGGEHLVALPGSDGRDGEATGTTAVAGMWWYIIVRSAPEMMAFV